ncbi:LytTR family DNA-binding domain-containing protein [Olivibacter ginsenosidimutans]|uniref:LytTR family DNA-binding domain-containing protein n=1 Tax=Olivibacter ginsenosidimutans TaxID=1176537 RepID=A0ABP9B288_9SPHI
MKCVVLDDEPLALQVLAHYIAKTPNLVLTASFRNAIEAFEYLRKHNIDVLFLDIEMPLVNGVHFLKALPKTPKTIFTTAYKHYAFDGFELDVIDYLLKPFSYERFLHAITKLKNNKPESSIKKNPLFIKTQGFLVQLYQEDIIYIESARDYIKLITIDGNYSLYHTLKGFLAKLNHAHFLQTHRSFLVNKQHIKRIDVRNIILSNDVIIPIGKSYKSCVIENISQL